MDNWLNEWSSNPTIILAVIAVVALIWQVGRWTHRIESGLETLRKEMGAQRRALEERIDTGLGTLRDEMRQQQLETRRTLDVLLLRVGGNAETGAGNSPLKVTEFGKRIEASLDAGDWIAATAEQLRPKTEGLEPFEIDELCHEYVRSSLDNEWRRRVRRAVYEFASDEPAVEMILRIRLREALLAKHEAPPNAPTAT